MSDETQQQQTELTEAKLAEMAATLDATGEVENPGEATPKLEATPASDAAHIKTKDGEQPAEKSELSPQEKGPGIEVAKQLDKETAKQESEYAKARREQERRERSWQKLEEEKIQLRKGREELETERRQVAQTVMPRDEIGYSEADYEVAAGTFDSRGDARLARMAREKGAALRQTGLARRSEAQVEQFRAQWTDTVHRVLEEKPELKDVNSPLARKVQESLRAHPYFSTTPDGFRRLVDYVELHDKAASLPGLRSEVEKLTNEIERLNKLTSVGGSGPTQRPGVRSFEDMTDKEREAELIRLADEADRQAI